MSDLTRRSFLKLGGGMAVGVGAASLHLDASASTTKPVAALKDVQAWKPVTFSYPGPADTAFLIDVGRAIEGGVGPNKSIVAFSGLCQHMGCPLNYNADSKLFVCGCHASKFDPARRGVAIEGPSTRGLPAISLSVSAQGEIVATGISEGMVYGRACNKS